MTENGTTETTADQTADALPRPATFEQAATALDMAARKHPKNRVLAELREFRSGELRAMAELLRTWQTYVNDTNQTETQPATMDAEPRSADPRISPLPGSCPACGAPIESFPRPFVNPSGVTEFADPGWRCPRGCADAIKRCGNDEQHARHLWSAGLNRAAPIHLCPGIGLLEPPAPQPVPQPDTSSLDMSTKESTDPFTGPGPLSAIALAVPDHEPPSGYEPPSVETLARIRDALTGDPFTGPAPVAHDEETFELVAGRTYSYDGGAVAELVEPAEPEPLPKESARPASSRRAPAKKAPAKATRSRRRS